MVKLEREFSILNTYPHNTYYSSYNYYDIIVVHASSGCCFFAVKECMNIFE